MRCDLPASGRTGGASRPPIGSSASRTSPTSWTRDLPPWGGAAPTAGRALTGVDALQIGDEVPPLVRILDAAVAGALRRRRGRGPSAGQDAPFAGRAVRARGG